MQFNSFKKFLSIVGVTVSMILTIMSCNVFAVDNNSASQYATYNGVSDHHIIPDQPNIRWTNQCTMVATVRFHDVAPREYGREFETIFAKSNWASGYGLLFFNGNNYNQYQTPTITFYHHGLSSEGTVYGWADVKPDVWYNIIYTYDGTFVKLYINGELRLTHGVSGTYQDTNSPFYFGMCDTGNSFPYYFDGDFKYVDILPNVITFDEIKFISDNMLRLPYMDSEGQ